MVAADTDAGWTSVLARGELEHRSTVEDLDTRPPGDGSVSQSERELEIPFYHVFDAPEEMLFTLVRLRTDRADGRRGGRRRLSRWRDRRLYWTSGSGSTVIAVRNPEAGSIVGSSSTW